MATSTKFADSRNSRASHIFSEMAFGKCRRVWRVLAKWFGECRQVWRVLAKLFGKCWRVWWFSHISQKGYIGECNYLLNLLSLPNLENTIFCHHFGAVFPQKWHLANVGESGESSQNSLANAGEPSKSRIFPKKAILQVLVKNLNFFFALAKFTCYTSSHWLNKP